MNFTELKVKIENATKQAFIEMFEKHKEEEIYAFALYSDEGAMTVCPSTNTVEFLKKQDQEDFLYYKFESAEWKYEMVGADDLFDEISTLCRETVFSMEDHEFGKFQKQLYQICIEVLEKLRSENFFKQIAGKDIFLLFTVSDYEFSKRDLQQIITSLNNNEYRDEYLEWMKTW